MVRSIHKFSLSVMLFAILLATAVTAAASDGQRKGFLVGVGAGTGFTTLMHNISSSGSSKEFDRATRMGLQTNFRIGHAPSNSLEIFYANKVSWFNLRHASGESAAISHGIAFIAVRYFFAPEAPAPFLSGGIGTAFWARGFSNGTSIIDKSYSLRSRGPGLFVAGGYEFSSHWDLQGTLMLGRLGVDDTDFELKSYVWTFQITLNATLY